MELVPSEGEWPARGGSKGTGLKGLLSNTISSTVDTLRHSMKKEKPAAEGRPPADAKKRSATAVLTGARVLPTGDGATTTTTTSAATSAATSGKRTPRRSRGGNHGGKEVAQASESSAGEDAAPARGGCDLMPTDAAVGKPAGAGAASAPQKPARSEGKAKSRFVLSRAKAAG